MDGIATTGRGFIHVAPDKAMLALGVSVLDRKAQAARETAAAAMQAVLVAVAAHAIDGQDRQTGILRVALEYDYKDGGQKLRGYRVTNTVTVVVRALDDLPSLIDDVLADGGEHVVLHGVEFDVEDRRSVENEALTAAIGDARARAEALAAASGVRLGPVSSIDARERDGGGPVPRMAMLAARSPSATPVEAGSIEVEAVADVVFEIAKG